MVARKLRFWLNALLFGLVLLPAQLPAAIIPVGDVTPLPWTISTEAYIGNTGIGTLDVTEGSQLVSRGGYLGVSSGSTGTVAITGAGSQWTIDAVANPINLFVGKEGSGTLTIADGGRVNSVDSYLGYSEGSTGTASVTGRHWTNSNLLDVGREGSGTLTVADGGQVTTGTLYASMLISWGMAPSPLKARSSTLTCISTLSMELRQQPTWLGGTLIVTGTGGTWAWAIGARDR